jgi:LacI family transcriptional regulator
MNFPEQVSAELRERVQSVATKLGWVPNGAARALATSRSGTIGAVFPTLIFGDFPRAIQALQHELARNGYTLLIAVSEYDLDQELEQVRKLLERGVDGLVLVGTIHHKDIDELCKRYKVPIVNTFAYDLARAKTCVGADNKKAFYRLTNYLADLGHQSFGLLAQTTLNNDRAQGRIDGVKLALAERSIAIPPQHYAEGRWGIHEGKSLLRRVLQQPPYPTAVICTNAYLAVGALLECQRLEIRVPEQMSIVGYDEIEIMAELPITITTVRVSGEEVGQNSARVLLAMLREEQSGQPHECSAELLIRDSSGPPRRDPLLL